MASASPLVLDSDSASALLSSWSRARRIAHTLTTARGSRKKGRISFLIRFPARDLLCEAADRGVLIQRLRPRKPAAVQACGSSLVVESTGTLSRWEEKVKVLRKICDILNWRDAIEHCDDVDTAPGETKASTLKGLFTSTPDRSLDRGASLVEREEEASRAVVGRSSVPLVESVISSSCRFRKIGSSML